MRPAVLHTKVPFAFLPRSETFIADMARGLVRYRPVAAGWTRENPELFPPGLAVAALAELPFPARLAERLRFRLCRRQRFIEELVRREDVRLAHAHFGNVAWFALRMLRGTGLPVLAHFHGRDATAGARSPLWRERYAEVFEGASAVLAASRSMADKLRTLGCPARKLVVHPYGVDLGRFRPPARRPENPELRFLFVGRMVPKKDPLGLLEALARAAPRLPAWSLTMAGDGPLLDEARRRAEGPGLSGRVAFAGALTPPAVLEAMGSHDLFVLPSRTAPDGDEESQALVLQEAQACGLPVVSTLHDGIPEGVLRGETGLLVEPGDPEALAGALLELAADPARRASLGAAGPAWVKSRFEIGALCRRLEDLYDAVLAGTALPGVQRD